LNSRRTRPQGGGKTRLDDRSVFTAIVFVLTSQCARHHVPVSSGVTAPTARRRFSEWTGAGAHDHLCVRSLTVLSVTGPIA
jgi:transposase